MLPKEQEEITTQKTLRRQKEIPSNFDGELINRTLSHESLKKLEIRSAH